MNAPPNHWIRSALRGSGTLTVYSAIPGKTILVAKMKWPKEKPMRGDISTSVEGALESLEQKLSVEAARQGVSVATQNAERMKV